MQVEEQWMRAIKDGVIIEHDDLGSTTECCW